MGAYNCENRVSKCIDSIIGQTYRDWEFIICDDCSTDHTLEVLKKYESQDKRIKIIKNRSNMKLAATLNHCLQEVKGSYIARIDDDDIALPDRIEKQAKFLNLHPEYAVVGSAARLTDGEKITGVRKAKEYPNKADVIYGPPHMHPTIMMRREAYDLLQGYTVAGHTKRGQDWDLWFRFYAAGLQGYNIQEELIVYHENQNDYRKRTIKTALGYTRTAINGYKLMKVPFWKYIFAIKPIVSYFIPEPIKKYRRHENI
jgi:glycosyltransferase EpsE